MLFNFFILFVFSLIGGAAAFAGPRIGKRPYRLGLVFSGAYLFGITIVHILPELFIQAASPERIGLYVLLGFFLQQWLETYSQGVEHGHLHEHRGEHKQMSGIILLIALSLHAFLEGTLLSHPSSLHPVHETGPLLWGIVLHKAPAAFALMSVIRCEDKSLPRSLLYLLIFALASPAGMWIGNYFVVNDLLSSGALSVVFAVVSGNFLHISTTIVFESNEHHRLNYQKWAVAIMGAGLAVFLEIL
jgi:zinc transporter ZupT